MVLNRRRVETAFNLFRKLKIGCNKLSRNEHVIKVIRMQDAESFLCMFSCIFAFNKSLDIFSFSFFYLLLQNGTLKARMLMRKRRIFVGPCFVLQVEVLTGNLKSQKTIFSLITPSFNVVDVILLSCFEIPRWSNSIIPNSLTSQLAFIFLSFSCNLP